ncbi:4Fe-4S single cluster domain-containing protein [Paenibacillus sp. 276b]|uniref:4Fe-4S single cluster domain-containing protein n=1 Tax=Paenibacillus sp. 276b TaxID=1566277 RepID=UPI00089D6CD8|nr:4Fe-4S single cluster domain-containing protein [Paenibacillus sp. 276b]SEB27690.1 anaerobic ribonucleoside-triphosphate reductase activating protein [Paenibacillus sp. 276b]
MDVKIHEITHHSTVNGPGQRSVIHFQGCKFQCPGCFNPSTHSLAGGRNISINEIISSIPTTIKDITISGGEPFLQPLALVTLAHALKHFGYSIVVFTGFYLQEIEKLNYGPQILELIDVLIDGRYDEKASSLIGLHGSDNQTIHFLSDRYNHTDFQTRDVEIFISVEGETQITGFPDDNLLKAFSTHI